MHTFLDGVCASEEVQGILLVPVEEVVQDVPHARLHPIVNQPAKCPLAYSHGMSLPVILARLLTAAQVHKGCSCWASLRQPLWPCCNDIPVRIHKGRTQKAWHTHSTPQLA